MYVCMNGANGFIVSHVRDCDLPFQVVSACVEDVDWFQKDIQWSHLSAKALFVFIDVLTFERFTYTGLPTLCLI